MKDSEEEIQLHFRPRATETVSIEIPKDTLDSLRKVAASRDMSDQALLKFYIGQGLRQDLSRLFTDRVLGTTAQVLARHIQSEEEITEGRKMMSSTNLERVMEEVKALTPDEQRQLWKMLDSLLAAPLPMTEDEFERRLLEKGIISEIKPPITDPAPYQNWKPVEVKGKPLSEIIIEERR